MTGKYKLPDVVKPEPLSEEALEAMRRRQSALRNPIRGGLREDPWRAGLRNLRSALDQALAEIAALRDRVEQLEKRER